MAHNHGNCCKHENVKYCQKCSVPYCDDCGKQWYEECKWNHDLNWTYTTPTITYPSYTIDTPYVPTCTHS